MSSPAPAARSDTGVHLGLFLLSAAILALEVLQVRILSVQLWYHHAFVVVTMAMLGFAAAGTVVTIAPGLRRNVRPTLAWTSLLFGVAVTVGHLLQRRTSDTVTTASDGSELPMLALAYVLLMVPYFFGGVVITLALSTGENVHTRYFFNLVGSALGAWLFVATIGPLEGERLLILCAAAGPLAAIAFAGPGAAAPRLASAAALLAASWLYLRAEQDLSIEIGEGKRKHIRGEHVARRWTPLCRIDVYADAPADPSVMHIVQDGAAGTYMFREGKWHKPPPVDTHSVAYVPHLGRATEGAAEVDALVIGIGGGNDLRLARSFGAKSVLGVEINAATLDLLQRQFADFNGHLATQPGVSLLAGEGRSTLRRLGRTFDLIQLAGADTYTAGVVSSFVLAESYLYTLEALRDYFDHLRPGGTLGVVRFFDEPDRETLRIFGMALLELRRRGVEKPSRHAAVLRSGWVAGTVFSLEPLAAPAIAMYEIADKDPTKQRSVVYVPGLESKRENAFTQLAAAIDAGKEEEFFSSYVVDARPVTDDSPFFYNFHHIWEPVAYEDSAFARALDSRIPVAPSILRTVLLQCSLLVVVLVLLPLWMLKRRGLRERGAMRPLVYFLALGAGFMLLEISSIQRLALFLGHPTYSLTVVLFSFLFFAGLGSLWSGRFLKGGVRATRIALAVVAIGILAFTFGADAVMQRFLHLPLAARIAIAVAFLAPINFAMGLPFPRGLALLQREKPELVPWAIGVNGGASVIGSVLATIVAIEMGFTAVALVALACYLAALLALREPRLAPAPSPT